MCSKIYTLLFLLTIQACSFKESIIDTQNGKTIGGYNKGDLEIAQKNRVQISDEAEKTWQKAGVYPYFNPATTLLEGIEIRNTKRFATSKGIKIGDSAARVEKTYGKPQSRKADFGNDGQVHWVWEGLFYKDKAFFTDSSGVIVGYYIGCCPFAPALRAF